VAKDIADGWAKAGLADAVDNSPNVELPLPYFAGNAQDTLDEANEYLVGRYLEVLDRLAVIEVAPPKVSIPLKGGWQRFNGTKWVESRRPADGSTMVADFETVDNGDRWYPTMLVCYVLDDGWYVWQWSSATDLTHTVSVGSNQVVVGHNVPYDRGYFTESYLMSDDNQYFDTMAAFMTVRGMSNQQISAYSSTRYTPWADETSRKGLSDVHEFYGYGKLDKTVRDSMLTYSPVQMWTIMPEVLEYCLNDVIATLKVFKAVYPELKVAQPSKTSFAGQMLLGRCWLPLSSDRFPKYFERAEYKYNETISKVCEAIKEAYDSFKAGYGDISDEEIPEHLKWLDWERAKTGKTKGQPKWLRATKRDAVTIKSRITPAVLSMRYMGLPLYWAQHPVFRTEGDKPCEGWRTDKEWLINFEDASKTVSYLFSDKLAKADWFNNDVLTCSIPGMDAVVADVISCVNWSGLRKRVAAIHTEEYEGFPVCVPAICVTGTITRRMADSTWQCSPNAKKTRIGTELKTMIEAPKGYKIVGADVDGQEAWIGSLFADALRGYCGSSAFGLTLLIGIKAQKTDVHSVISALAGIGRTLAKNIFYGMLYGLGTKGVFEYIRKSNAKLTDAEVQSKTDYLIRMVKGLKIEGKWVDGLASDAFNYMERLIQARVPRTPVLKAALTHSLASSGKDFKTTKTNWCIQSSGVDMRDMLITFVDYFVRRLGLQAKLLMTIHDEVRYLVKEEQAQDVAYALQLAHLYTRAIFIDTMGLDGIPQACAWFSGVDIDHVWRKVSVPDPSENGADNAESVTPSQDAILPYGVVLSPLQISVPF
jgi:DNA polymerase gamma 1